MPQPFFVTTTFNFDGYVIKAHKGVVRAMLPDPRDPLAAVSGRVNRPESFI